jgi:exonuclease I
MKKLKIKQNLYEVAFSSRKQPNSWNSVEVQESELLLKLAEIMSNTEVQVECVALVASNHPNRNELPMSE